MNEDALGQFILLENPILLYQIFFFFFALIFEWLKCRAHSHWQTRKNSQKKKSHSKTGEGFGHLTSSLPTSCNEQDAGREGFAPKLLYFRICNWKA